MGYKKKTHRIRRIRTERKRTGNGGDKRANDEDRTMSHHTNTIQKELIKLKNKYKRA